MLKLIQRTALSITLGLVCTVLLLLLLHYSSEGPFSNNLGSQFLSRLFFWPANVFDPLAGLDCPAADSVGDKLDCIGITVAVNVFTYGVVCFGLLEMLKHRRREASLT